MFISAVKLNIIIWESLPRVATRGTTVSGTSASAPWRLLLGQYERFSYIIMKITIRSRHLSGPFNRLDISPPFGTLIWKYSRLIQPSMSLRSTVTGWGFQWVPKEKQFPPPPIKSSSGSSESVISEQNEWSIRGQGTEVYTWQDIH